MADFDIFNKLNPGLYIEERDLSVYNVTQFYNQITLVLGCSKEGPINIPIVNISPDNFEQKYGEQDYSLERKGSYFHRTTKDLLQEGPVLTVNLRITDRNLDKYNWINLSTSSDTYNSNTRTNPIEDFYNTADGFWRKSVDRLIQITDDNAPDANKNPFSIVNQGAKPVSILVFKSTAVGFDITVESWYDSKTIPLYLHPKDLISDYIVDVYAIEGRWNDYKKLSTDAKWSKYFSINGFRRETIKSFINEVEVVLIDKWTGSLIPYFKDKAGKNMFIQSIINNDVDESGLWMSYNSDIIETDYRNGLLDLVGDNLTANNKPGIDFLSYKKNMTDLYLVEEKLLDQPGNSFGNPNFSVIGGREQYYTEGYIYGCKLKNIIVSTTNTLTVKPLDCFYDDAYGIINGIKIDLNSDISYDLVLQDILTPGNKITFALVLTVRGVEFRISNKIPNHYTPLMPSIDSQNEIVMGYYIISQDLLGYETENYDVKVFGVTIDSHDFINPFTNNTNNKITLRNTSFIWQQELVFNNIKTLDSQNFNQARIYHLWYWLSKNLKEKESLFIDIDGNKQIIDTIEQYVEGNNKVVKISIIKKDSNIQDTDGTSGTSGLIGMYMEDLEFLSRKEIQWLEKIEPFVDGSNGIIGDDSFIYDSFVKGEINSGDPFFRSLGEEDDVIFYSDGIYNYIILKEGPNANYIGEVIVYGSKNNDGIFNVLNSTNLNGYYALYVQENIIPETVDKLRFYDAANPKIVNLYFVSGKLKAKVEDYNGDSEELYRRIFGKVVNSQWKKTLEIEHVLDTNRVLVNAQTYGSLLNYNYYLLANNPLLTDDDREVKRNWTRIVDLVRWAADETLMLVETDAPIAMKSFEGDLQTEYLIPIDSWVDTLDFKVLEPFVVRPETLPDGTEQRQNDILNLISNTKMASTLCIDRIEWRYLVDSFGLGLVENSKYQLAQLCQNKQLAMGFLNMPSIKQFRNNTTTSFTTNGSFNTKLLLTGGDRRNSDGGRFSLSDVGKSYAMYITPYVVVSERGRKFEVPPSAAMARLYMKKHNSNQLTPWSIMAGASNKITQIAGLEELFSPEQLVDLHRLRVTPITNYQNVIFYPYAENTSETMNSALGYAHNREALIELEMALKQELNNYQWSPYTKDNTKLIVNIANSICDGFKKLEAIAEYRNYFDYDPELVDAQIAVLNTYVEPVAGMGSILFRVNILKTKGLEGI